MKTYQPRTYQQKINYEELELIRPQGRKPKTKQLAPLFKLKQRWQALLTFWELDEPRISDVVDRSGKVSWRIYDPARDRTFQLDTKEQVLAWLEERHYRRQQSIGWNIDW